MRKSLQDFINADPKRKQEYGDPWAEISKAVSVQKADVPAIYLH